MRSLAFAKYEGLGNDFIIIEAERESDVEAPQVIALCDRRFGIGGDGVLLVLPAEGPEAVHRMKVINADGTVPEMCGNGLRCVAIHVARARGRGERELVFETDAGARRCVIADACGEGMVSVDMGVIGVAGDRVLDLDGESVTLTLADAGNPHAILFGERTPAEVERLGAAIARHSVFSRGTNVEFARVSGGAIDLTVWERGVGITMACGTGACATAAVACDKGFLPRNVAASVRLPGGALEITIDDRNRATMRGPARRVFSGTSG